MNAIRTLLTTLRHMLGGARELFRYALLFLWTILGSEAVLAARLLAVES